MSALLLKADMCAAPADVGYGPMTAPVSKITDVLVK
jgi:hypothetical protein